MARNCDAGNAIFVPRLDAGVRHLTFDPVIASTQSLEEVPATSIGPPWP